MPFLISDIHQKLFDSEGKEFSQSPTHLIQCTYRQKLAKLGREDTRRVSHH